jgi:hypothetical protein
MSKMNKNINAADLVSPYENIVIGNFLYGLGLAIGTRSGASAPKGCINLMQQTPLDQKLGDVMLQFPGMLRLLEFKRSGNASDKENYKLKMLRVVIAKHLVPVSRAIHWYVESMPSPAAGNVPIRLCCYLELDTSPTLKTLADFSNEFAQQALDPPKNEPTPELISEYLRCLGDLAKEGTASGGGMLVKISPDGQLSYVVLSDIRQLILQHTHMHVQQHQLAIDIEMGQDAQHKLQYSLERQPTKGLGR